MRAKQNKLLIASLILVFSITSCEESKINYSGMPIDNRLIGDWHRSYSLVGNDWSITILTDSIKFNSNNLGSIRLYKFLDLDAKYTFQFCTEADSIIHIKYDDINDIEKWFYTIRNDSLFILGSIPYIR